MNFWFLDRGKKLNTRGKPLGTEYDSEHNPPMASPGINSGHKNSVNASTPKERIK